VIVIEDLFCPADIQAVAGGLVPRDFHQPVQVGPNDAGLTGIRMHVLQSAQLLEGLLQDCLRHLGGLDGLADLDQFLFFSAVTQFLLDGTHLFPQVIFALVLAHLFASGALDLGLNAQEFDFAVEEFVDLGQPHNRIVDLQQRLGVRNLQAQVAGDQVPHAAGILDIFQDNQHFGRNLFTQLHHLGQLLTNRTDQCLGFQGDVQQQVIDLALGTDRVKGFVADILGNAGLGQPLHENLDPPVRQLEHAHDHGDSADFIDLVGGWILVPDIVLGSQQDHTITSQGIIHGLDRHFTPDKERNDHEGVDHHIPHRQQWEHLGNLQLLRILLYLFRFLIYHFRILLFSILIDFAQSSISFIGTFRSLVFGHVTRNTPR